MNRSLNLRLATKLNLIIIAAVLIPLIAVGTLTRITFRGLALSNLETVITENGSRRQATVENEIRAALNEVNEFVNNNQSTMAFSLQQAISSQSDVTILLDTNETLQNQFRSQLLASGYFTTVQMVTLQFRPYAEVTRADLEGQATTPFSRDAISTIVEPLDLESGNLQGFGVTQTESERSRVTIITAIVTEDATQNRTLLGYLLAEVDKDRVFISALEREDTSAFNTYAYIILPGTNEVIAPPEFEEEGLIDATSLGAQRALANRAATAETYLVGDEDNRREVVGYSALLIVDDERFAIMTSTVTVTPYTKTCVIACCATPANNSSVLTSVTIANRAATAETYLV
ncbi:MAG: hypothetical protein AAFQ07_11365, partial [Chloroflexota bacterium]